MRSVEEHYTHVIGLVSPLEVVTAGLLDALGCALAGEVTAPIALPGFDNSAVDGYAVRIADIASAPVTLPVSADVAAGSGLPAPLPPGTAARIMTGAPLPAGADAIVRVELTDAGTEAVTINSPVPVDRDIRREASDTAIGDVVLSAGMQLNAARLALISALGSASAQVHRRPRIAVVSTGSELTSPGKPLAPGAIYDSNSFMLSAAVIQAGGVVTSRLVLNDDADTARPALSNAAAGADLVITSGGISAGAYEVIKDVLGPTGGVDFVSVAMQPGKPQGAGVFEGTPVITLPGNPVSSAVSFEVFVRPAIRKLGGHGNLNRPEHHAVATHDLELHPKLRRYRRGWFDPDSGTVELVGGMGSHLLASLALSNCLIILPQGDGLIEAGKDVPVILTS